ncbi:MAG: hypothetical protein AAF501_20680 [Pseudomonadota bacterium]
MTSTVLTFPVDTTADDLQPANRTDRAVIAPRRNVPNDPKTWTLAKKIDFAIRWKLGTAILRAFGINGL